jgi:hypothetical protein
VGQVQVRVAVAVWDAESTQQGTDSNMSSSGTIILVSLWRRLPVSRFFASSPRRKQ